MEPERKIKTRDDDENGTEEMRKKKKSGNDGTEEKRKKRRGKAEEEEEEKEVEEFFAILRRIRVAVKYFENAKKQGRRELPAATTDAWKPTFELQDFEDVVEDNSGLDLNSEPTIKHPQG